jgi:hypothetical protein
MWLQGVPGYEAPYGGYYASNSTHQACMSARGVRVKQAWFQVGTHCSGYGMESGSRGWGKQLHGGTGLVGVLQCTADSSAG